MDKEKFKKKQLEILDELDRVCRENHIHYYLAYGSCLGAIRHKGFIPWDDDIDVVMTAEEMDRLIAARDSFGEKYFLQCRSTDKNWSIMSCSLRDSSTSFFAVEEGAKDINHGIEIDIYVLYPYPDNPSVAHKLIVDSYILRLLYMKQCGETPRHHGKAATICSKALMNLYSNKEAEKKIERVENLLKNNGGEHYYSVFFGNDITLFHSLKFPVEMFKEPKYLPFEGVLRPCPSLPELMCEICYGTTYMEYPPEEKRISPHDIVYLNCDEPYTKFEGQYYFKNRKTR